MRGLLGLGGCRGSADVGGGDWFKGVVVSRFEFRMLGFREAGRQKF